jgi:hypothetical protein
MPQGIEELTADALWGAVRQGVEQAAKLAGVKAQDVERLLPAKELQACLEQLRQSQQAALKAWSVHAGQLGGLLKGVADLTVDGRAILPSGGIARIARKVRRDKPLSAPLQAFADDLLRWEELIEQCRVALDGGAELAKAYRRRRIRNAVIAVVSAAAAAAMIAAVLVVRASRARIDDALGSKQVCAVEAISATDLGRGSDKQKQGVAERLRGCEAERAAEAFVRDEVRRHEEDEKEAARLQEELDTKCEALAERAAAGKLAKEDTEIAGPRASLLSRIRFKSLSPRDLGPRMPELPCEGTRGEPKLRTAFVEAAVVSPWRWVGAVDPADEVRELLAPRAGDISERARMVLGVRAGEVAKRAIKKGNAATMEKAGRLCAFAEALQVPGGDPCDALKALPAGKNR